jgi:molybdate/tungstate transport system ATP-binding protein
MIELDDITIDVGGFALQNVSFTVAEGEFFLLLGPTGAGKTLTLEAVAGLIPLTSGRIRVRGVDVTSMPPERRGVGIVYQDYALFPHMTAWENVCYGIRYLKKHQPEARKQAEALTTRVGIDHLRNRRVTHLSGGEKQRVALVRALSVKPAVLLLDEPLSALDPRFRDDIRKVLKTLHEETGTTFLMVTHDFAEALFLGNRAAVLKEGRIEQTGEVTEVFRYPKTPFVADFVGITNIFEAAFNRNTAFVETREFRLEKTPDSACRHIAVRPEEIRVGFGEVPTPADNTFTGRVIDLVDRGPYGELTVRTGDLIFRAVIPKTTLLSETGGRYINRPVTLHIPPSAVHVL